MKKNVAVHLALAVGAVLAMVGTAHSASMPASSPIEWKRVYRHDFADVKDLDRYESDPKINSTINVYDRSNKPLQRPILKSNVTVVDDPDASDGKAVAVYTRIADFKTTTGTLSGWTNGRFSVAGHNQSVPVRVQVRLRMTPSMGCKSAVMWWPEKGWPWEVDFAETFGGESLTDKWGSRHTVTERWHADINHDGAAKEQLIHDFPLDATVYHVYDLNITPEHMWVNVDGKLIFETREKKWIPTTPGHFSIGKAMTGRRNSTKRSEDAVFVDWLEIYKPQ